VTDQTKDVWDAVAGVLFRCWILGFALLFVWLGVSQLMGELIHRLHGSMFGLSRHELGVIFYCGMGLLKLCVLTFFLIPWLAIRMMLKTQVSIDATK